MSLRSIRATLAALAARLLSPALPLSVPISPRSEPIPRPGPRSRPRSRSSARSRSLAVTCAAGCGTTLPVTKLRIAAQSASAIVTRVRRHHPPVRALRGNLILFALGHCEICKADHASEYRNSEEYLDHVPTSLAECSCLEPL